LPCGCGNGAGYSIVDFDGADFTMTRGAWNTGAYPTAAGFSPDSRLVAASNRFEVSVFDVTTHVRVESAPHTGCAYDNVRRVRFSQGGRWVFTLLRCGFDGDSGQIEWISP
jgi:hypothetical protein